MTEGIQSKSSLLMQHSVSFCSILRLIRAINNFSAHHGMSTGSTALAKQTKVHPTSQKTGKIS